MKDEVLQKALSTDTTVIPRYDVVKPDGSKVAENVQLVLKNEVLTPGTPLNKQNLLSDDAARAYGLDPTTATPDVTLRTIRNSVGYCPRVRIEMLPGSIAHVKNMDSGEVKQYIIPATGYIFVDLLAYGTYNIWGVYDDVATTTQVLVVDTTKMYHVRSYSYTCTWKFLVDAEIGATIVARHVSGLSFSGTVGLDKTCSIALPMTGTYAAVGVYDGCNSESYTFTATVETEGTTYTTSMKWITADIKVSTGSIVTLKLDSITRGGISANGVAKVWLPSKGTWVVIATMGNGVTTGSIEVSAYQNYSLSLSYYNTYGVRIPLGNSSPTAGEYTDDAVGMSTGYNAWATNKIFSMIRPCLLKDGVVQYYLNKNNLTQKEDGSAATITSATAGDVMVEIPKIGYRIYSDESYLYVKITDKPDAEGFCYLAHSLDAVNDCDKIYIGAYLANNVSNKLYSISNAAPVKSISIENIRAYAGAKGTGYQSISFYPWTLLQCLYIIMYKNLNSEKSIGYGYISSTTTTNTGGTNSKGPCFGVIGIGSQMCFLNIEDMWGNALCVLDGICTDRNFNVYASYKDFNNTGAEYPYTLDLETTQISGYMSRVYGTNEFGFLPRAVQGSETTYFCDQTAVHSGSIATVGNVPNLASGPNGIFRLEISTDPASSSNSTRSARIMYKHKA